MGLPWYNGYLAERPQVAMVVACVAEMSIRLSRTELLLICF